MSQTQFNGFGSLDLSGDEAEQGRKSLAPGKYVVTIKEASVDNTKGGGGKGVKVVMDDGTGAQVTDFINVANKNPEAVKIGRSRLKALLIAAGHPNPNKPEDVKSLVGLKVGVHVEQGEDWIDDQGNKRKGGGKLRKRGPYFAPNGEEAANLGPAPASAGSTNGGTGKAPFDDKIPF